MKRDLLESLRGGEELTLREQILLIAQLSLPAILAQISGIVMQYIDASMVGRLGAADSASIGLMASSTWLFNGLCIAAAMGFTVQVAQRIGAGQVKAARNLMKQGLLASVGFGVLLAAAGTAMSGLLPSLYNA